MEEESYFCGPYQKTGTSSSSSALSPQQNGHVHAASREMMREEEEDMESENPYVREFFKYINAQLLTPPTYSPETDHVQNDLQVCKWTPLYVRHSAPVDHHHHRNYWNEIEASQNQSKNFHHHNNHNNRHEQQESCGGPSSLFVSMGPRGHDQKEWPRGVYECSKCPYVTSRQSTLSRHLLSKHGCHNWGKFACVKPSRSPNSGSAFVEWRGG